MRQLLLASVLLLSACGFHPRGSLAVSEQLGPVAVQTSDPYSELNQGLTSALRHNGATISDAASGVARLHIVSEAFTTTPLSVDENAFVREYITHYRVEFRLDAADGSVRLPLQVLDLSRDYTFDSLASAGNPAEQELIQKELRRDMQAAIVRQLDIALRTQP